MNNIEEKEVYLLNKTIIDFYMITNVLKHKIRTGWEELGISSERLESVAEHIYGCLMLAIAIYT